AAAAACAQVGDAPSHARALVLQARLQRRAGDVAGALATLAEARALAPDAALVQLQVDLAEATEPGAVLALETRAEALQAGELRAEAAWQAGELLSQASRRAEADHAFQRARDTARQGGLALLAALATLGMGRTAFGADAANARGEGERALKALAAAAGPGFDAWPERRIEAAPAGEALPIGLAETLGMLADLRAATSLDDLLARLLRRALAVAGAEAGALLAYRDHQLEAYAREFLADAEVLEKPALDAALWYGEAVISPEAWTLPVRDAGEVVAVLYVEAGQPDREATLRHVTEAIGFAVAQAMRLARYERGVERLAFSEGLARQALAAGDATSFARDALKAALQATGAERAFLILADGSRPAALRADGQALAADAAVSQSVVRHVLATGEGVRLLDPQHMEGWSQQQSILALGLQSIVAVPLPAGRGVLYVDSGNAAQLLGGREQDLLAAAAEILGAVLARS
ncbi:MAG: hypothetical protein JWM80_1232, partial [Cyanobacteria bacterium RYN_339]|nr:hypothetical protein [Cyanobacteria bacterium RYN_339]